MKTASRRQEERLAKQTGGRRTPGSGNGIIKNDVRTAEISWELKTTNAKQYTLKNEDLVLAEKYALLDNRDMRFRIEMCGREWVVLSAEDYEVLEEKARENGS